MTATPQIPADAYLLIIGAMKCGTSSLFDAISQHPAICPSSAKEPEYFSRHQQHRRAVERYEDLWPTFSRGVHRCALEASTGYTKYPSEPDVPERMADYGLAPRFVYVVRNPFDRITSHVSYMNMVDGGRAQPTDDQVVATSQYHRQLERFRAVFPDAPLLVLDFGDLVDDLDAVARRVFDFAGLDDPGQLRVAARNTLEGTSPLARKIRRGPAGRVVRLLPPDVRRAGVRVLTSLRRSAPERRVLTDVERDEIREALAPDMARLREDYGVAVERWGFDPRG